MNNNIYLKNYHDRSIFDSNCIEFWAPVTDLIVPNVAINRYWVSTFGNTWNTNTNRPIGLSMHHKGYWQFSLMTKDQKQVTRKLHRTIMMTFCYFPGCELLEVNHIDSIRTHNWLTNLEWTTPSENTIHGINFGNKKIFGNDYKVKLTNQDIINIINMPDYLSANKIKHELNLDVSTELIVSIRKGKSRTNLINCMSSTTRQS